MNDIELLNEGMKMIDVDTTKAFEYFSKSAEAGNADAMYYLGLIYESGDGAEMNVKKALEMFEKSRAAGCKSAASNIGNLYHYGHVDGLEPDSDRAFPYLLRAAHDDIINAMRLLSEIYLFGTDAIFPNYRLAAYWALRGIEEDDTDCWYLIAVMYEHGLFFEKNLSYAKQCLKNALPMEVANKYLHDKMYTFVIPRKPNLASFDDTAADFFADELPQGLDEQAKAIIYG